MPKRSRTYADRESRSSRADRRRYRLHLRVLPRGYWDGGSHPSARDAPRCDSASRRSTCIRPTRFPVSSPTSRRRARAIFSLSPRFRSPRWRDISKTCGVPVVAGPGPRAGAVGTIQSVYIRDPDQTSSRCELLKRGPNPGSRGRGSGSVGRAAGRFRRPRALKNDWTAARSWRLFGGASAAPQRFSAARTEKVRTKVSLPTMRKKLDPECRPSG